ncbi:MAG TPA: hypothetical protein VLD62_01375, partial [Acidimicrobiia bacterium]|nr:hypothetical protein [Acidimicrobiia bacterium]
MTVAPDLVRRFRDANPVLPDQQLPEFLTEARPSLAEIMELEPRRLAPTWRRTGLVAVAAAFVIALAVAIPLILFGGDDPQVADEPETTTS